MGKRASPVVVQIQAEGTKADKALIREETYNEARKLADKMPTFGPDRLIYVRNLTEKVLKGKIDREVFTMFIKATNSFVELQTCLPRAKQIVGRRGK